MDMFIYSLCCYKCSVIYPRGTADAEINGWRGGGRFLLGFVLFCFVVGAQGHQRFPLSKPVVSPSIALHAVPAYGASTYLVSAFPAHSTSFFPNFLQSSTVWNVH